VLNLYDLTGGNYLVRRTVSFPDFPQSRLVFDADVEAVSASEWKTTLTVAGTYDGPTDVVGVRDYELEWTVDGNTLIEKGTATLILSSGRSLLSQWSSAIVVKGRDLRGFNSASERLNVSFSPFRIAGDSMSYEWRGTVSAQKR
jgi:hypothetical protein